MSGSGERPRANGRVIFGSMCVVLAFLSFGLTGAYAVVHDNWRVFGGGLFLAFAFVCIGGFILPNVKK